MSDIELTGNNTGYYIMPNNKLMAILSIYTEPIKHSKQVANVVNSLQRSSKVAYHPYSPACGADTQEFPNCG